MNNKEVYINGILLDLDESKSPIQLTYSVNDLAELKDRQAYSSNIFKVPLTYNNRKACGLPDDANLIQITPYRNNAGRIVQGGIEVIANGIAIVQACSDVIEVQILSGIKGFFDAIGDKKISELDLSAYDHIWNLTNVINSQTATDGYIYPIIDYGQLDDVLKEADARLLRPATFRKTIIEAIVAEAGYTIIGNALSYPKYLNSIIPFTNDKFEHGAGYDAQLATYKTSARNTVDQVTDEADIDTVVVLQDDATSDQYNQWNGSIFTAGNTYRAKLTFNYTIEQRDTFLGGGNVESYLRIEKLIGGVWTTLGYNITTQSTVGGFSREVFRDQTVVATDDMSTGDQYRILHQQHPGANRMISIIYAGAKLTVEPISQDVIYGSEVQLSATLPDISQTNFFKEFLQNFGLIVVPNNYTKSLELINLEEVYANKPNAIDITDKGFRSVRDIKYSYGNYGINNYGRYKEDDAVPDGFGDGVMVFDNLTLENEVTLFTSVFAGTITSSKQGLIFAEIKKIEDRLVSLEFKTKTQPRILLDVKQNAQLRIFDGNGSQVVNSISLPTFNGLSYADLFAENYPELQKMLYRPFIVELEMLISEVDLAQLDWRVPLYDGLTASYYYRNSIKYVQGGISRVNMIKM